VTSYLRPNQTWQCGRLGAPCLSGPDRNGQCSSCDEPCQPIRSVQSRTRLITFMLLTIAVGLLTLLLTQGNVMKLLSPGPLSLSHAEVAGCQDCHSAVSEPVSAWVGKALTLNSGHDDKQCLQCHELGENAFQAHTVSSNAFSSVAAESGIAELGTAEPRAESPVDWKVMLASQLNEASASASDSTSCSSCHREHKGKLHPLNNFDPQRCHTCHQQKFDAIEESHPEYTSYPHKGATRINFDHAAHLEGYFYEDDYFDMAPVGCKQCHDTDKTGEWMLSSRFEDTCSSCHQDQILGDSRAGAKGIPVLTIPELDIGAIEQAGYYVGDWPKWADGEMAPIMRLILKGTVKSSILNDNNITLYDLSEAEPEQLEQVAVLAWRIKELFFDIQTGGTAVLQQRLTRGYASALDASTVNRLIASLPRDTLINNQQEWFPNLAAEISAFRSGEMTIMDSPLAGAERGVRIPSNALPEPEDSDSLDDDTELLLDEDLIVDEEVIDDEDIDIAEEDTISIDKKMDMNTKVSEEWASSGGWYRDGSNIRYRPMGHADSFIKTWLDLSSAGFGELGQGVFASLTNDDSVGSCTKCHSVGTAEGSFPKAEGSLSNVKATKVAKKVNWHGFRPDEISTDFNRFSHVAHFSLMTDDGCSSCHLLKPDDDTAEINSSVGSFMPMTKSTCTECHQQGRAPANCLTCHQYHAGKHTRTIDQITDSLTSGLTLGRQ
jgi:hypothetical protein